MDEYLGASIDTHQHGDVDRVAVSPPSSRVILMRLEALRAGELEVDLLLVRDGRLLEEIADGLEHLGSVRERVVRLVELEEVLDALQDTSAVLLAVLKVHHPLAGRLGPALHLGREVDQLLHLVRREQGRARQHEETVALEVCHLLG